jgi:hypothetical protein
VKWAGGPRVTADPGRATLAAALLGLTLLAGARAATASPAEGPDSLRLRVEIGASSDYTNEVFYEDTFDSTALTGRRLVDSPETRYAGVLSTRLTGTRGRRSTRFDLANDLSLGDLLKRDVLSMTMRAEPTSLWTFYGSPRLEYRRDRTFDRDLDEWRGSAGLRARRRLSEGAFAELGARGELLRSSGRGSEFILDRQGLTGTAAFEQAPLWGPEWRVEYGLTRRVFPDSSERDHYQHAVDGHLRVDLPGGRPLLVEAGADRRATIEAAPTSRDNFWEERGAVEAEVGLTEALSLRARVEAEAIQYDLEDSTLFFDYQELRARVGPRLQRGTLSLALGPRIEAVFARLDPSEGYQEIAAMAEVESLGSGTWWSVIPIAGWRDYDEPAPGAEAIGVHSSYAFYEIGVMADQAVPGGFRLRLFGNARFESHVDDAEDARSLYFSLDLRRLF